MAGNDTQTNQIGQYYPVLQPLMSNIQDMTPPGQVSSEFQGQALTQIANQQTAENPAFIQQLSSSLNDQVDEYIKVSNTLNDYNEIHNTNTYIEKELTQAEREMKRRMDRLKSQIYISKEKTQLYEYDRNRLKFYKALFLVTVFVVIDLLTVTAVHLNGQMSSKTLYTLMGVTMGLYLLVVILVLYANAARTNRDWKKFNWGTPRKDSIGKA
jgi:hypothetical protein